MTDRPADSVNAGARHVERVTGVKGGYQVHERGIVPGQPGLRFWGLFFLHALSSETLTGMPIDARYVVDHVASIRHDAMTG
jgi:hypothetical protein